MISKVFDSFSKKIPLAVFLHGVDFTEAEKCVQNLFAGICEDEKVLEKPKVDELKSLTHWINLQPSGEFKVIQIRRLESVSKEAINYLLKAVEDSPSYLKWVFYSHTRHLNKALLSRCYCIAATSDLSVPDSVGGFDQVKDFGSAYDWFLKNKETLSDAEFKNSLIGCCDILLQNQTNFDRIHLVQKYKNLIKKESAGYENSFKFLLTQVF